ncbi:tetratricopeptide repeat protein [Campylobacter helveticus]|uniref:Tetratricopeptide repeat protein n=1 Tax=Campylobacter helveticus TaxID=28898 RepID=A0AAX2UL60_9BACT|nr:hypothetical protein [Campylobacter helveticus]MCR2038951.1 hypothetical protein [Campylobacter helveticus]MCR2057016.1 hypothetical protein [Campylobacter helveticus]MCR2059252.1 hypothetical protein [Campylobacter helveticus]MCR2063975.1 hypothetical protein [Campylobacter helveticus]MCR2067085.1 hypothetical protein [Campylobacter helveticus]
MDFFFVEYRDPIVGLIFLTLLILVVALANYAWRIFANKDEEQKLEKFIKKFELENSHKNLLRSETLSFSNLSFLAEIFTKSGEFEKATQIYLIALEKTKDKDEQEAVFLALAKVYFKAGFLQKCTEVLLNALKIRPRNKEALKLLKIAYFKLKMYKENLELLECLFELGEDIKEEAEFIKALSLENKKEAKEQILKLDYENNASLKRYLFEKYHIFKKQNLAQICDVLYKDKKPINTDDEKYYEFFYMLGLVEEKQGFRFKNSHFKMYQILKQNNFKARLDFSYMCLECKNIMPLFFYHCPICYEFNRCKILYEVKNDEAY